MYKMKADGVVFYDPSSDDLALQVLSPKAKYELNKSGTLTFTLLPGNVMYDGLHKMKTIVTLEQDGEVIFRGRVLETVTDSYNQREVYCESELSYLLDSLVRPYQFDGKASDLFRQLVETHNEQVDDYKRFEVGIITAVDDEDETETDSEAYTDTLAEIRQMLINPFDGYLRIRVENGVRYLDWIDEYDDECGQAIEFGVNLVDIENRLDAGDICTVLVPLGGYNSKHQDPITIAEVNDGKDYLEDADGIAKYGRIFKTFKWEDLTDPQEIKDEGLKQLEKMKEARTLTIKAVDLHIVDASVDSIRLGKKVKLLSSPHGLNEPDICSKIDLDVENPENTEYTFGIPQESLTDKNASRVRQYESAMNETHKWLWETEEGLYIAVENVNALGNRTTNLEISVDAVEEAILLKADKTVTDDLGTRISGAEVRISAAESEILLKASQSDMNDVFLRLDAAEGTLTAQAKTIDAKADLILLNGYVKASELEADVLTIVDSARVLGYLSGNDIDVQSLVAGSVNSEYGSFDSLTADSMTINGSTAATQAWVESKGYVTASTSSLTNYYTKNEVYSADETFNLIGTYLGGYGYATQDWVTENFSNARTTYSPASIERYGTVSGTTIPVRVLNADGTELLTGSVDAGDVYTAGFQAALDSIWLDAQISSITNVAANTMYASGYARVYSDNTLVTSMNLSKSQVFPGLGQ